jgi:hypothetical protein
MDDGIYYYNIMYILLSIHCHARQFWEGGDGNLMLVIKAESLAKLDWSDLRPGGSAQGAVIAYLDDAQCLSSDPLHDGVGDVRVSALIAKKNDARFAGPVRAER